MIRFVLDYSTNLLIASAFKMCLVKRCCDTVSCHRFRRGEEKVDEIKFKLVVYNESAHADSRQLPETPRVGKCPWGSDLFHEDL